MTKIKKSSVIAAVRSESELDAALASPSEMIFDLAPNILTLHKTVKKAHTNGKRLLIHLDLAEGIGKDRSGLVFAKETGIDGVISTRVNIIKMAKELGIFTVQRFFIVDSHSIETTMDSLRASKADMIEVMPGIAYKGITRLCAMTSVPIIAGGLIDSYDEVEKAIVCGATAVSTGKKELWEEMK